MQYYRTVQIQIQNSHNGEHTQLFFFFLRSMSVALDWPLAALHRLDMLLRLLMLSCDGLRSNTPDTHTHTHALLLANTNFTTCMQQKS